VAQCVWWLALIIGLEQELTIHIDNLRIRSSIAPQEVQQPLISEAIQVNKIQLKRAVSTTPRDLADDSRQPVEPDHIYSDRKTQVRFTTFNISGGESSNQESELLQRITPRDLARD